LRILSAYLFLILVLAACQPAESTPLLPEDLIPQTITPRAIPEDLQTATPDPALDSTLTQPSNHLLTPENTELSPALTPDAAAQKMVDLAKENLAQRLGIAIDQITLVEVRPAVWRDGGLGCPRPGVDYIPMETPGYSIVLEASGQNYNYHTDANRRFVLCNRP
jgi:hypothetical protein